MNKRWLCVILLSASLLNATVEHSKQSLLSIYFVSTIKTHYVEPSWILPAFFAMNLQEFDDCWNILVTIIKQKPWYLLCSKQCDYSERKYRAILINHCKAYDSFLQNLFVNLKDNTMIFTQGKPPKGYISIYDYWKKTGSTSASHFYAFYFDRVGGTYIEAVNNAFLNMDHQDYKQYVKESWSSLGTLSTLLKNLMNSSYEARYSDHLKKYREVRRLLLKEKQQLDAL